MMQTTVGKIHFDDFGGTQFERLVFAYVSRLRNWDEIKWLGETGQDGGRDIWGSYINEDYCYQCANYKTMTLKKAKEDIDKIIEAKTVPNFLYIVCGGTVTNAIRTEAEQYARNKGIKKVAIWSGAEFEELLRKDAPELLKRFTNGEAFPDSPGSLLTFAKDALVKNDASIISAILQNFDRPAFHTSFLNETSLPNFERALEDTIALLNTGIHRLTDGTIISRLPSRHQLVDAALKKGMAALTDKVIKLRDRFVQLRQNGDIKICSCDDANCTAFFTSDAVAQEMNDLRNEILQIVRTINNQ